MDVQGGHVHTSIFGELHNMILMLICFPLGFEKDDFNLLSDVKTLTI